MIHGTLIVEPADEPATADDRAAGAGRRVARRRRSRHARSRPRPRRPQERRAEIADLTRRVLVGAVLTAAGAVRGDGPRGVRRRLGARRCC